MNIIDLKNKPLESYTIIGAILLLSLFLIIKPSLSNRDATRTLITYLTNLQKGDVTTIYTLWDDKANSPPIYSLSSYKINDHKFFKQDDMKRATYHATLNFEEGNILPSGKEWTFELGYTKVGWKLLEAYMPE